MTSLKLEFRGIPIDHLRLYFLELEGKELTNHLPYVFKGRNWVGEILSQDEITFTSAFKVNTVLIRFTAENESDLEELIKRYRYKTTRIGG